MTWMDAPGFSSRNKGYNSATLKSIIDKTELPVCIVEKKELPVCIVEKKRTSNDLLYWMLSF